MIALINGYRPKRSAHDALKQCQDYITMGYKYTVDMDLEKFFDTVNHSKRAAQRTLDHIVPFIEGKLYLKVNKERTIVAHVREVKFLGHGFYVNK